MSLRPSVLSIGGSDSAGLAGIQMDVKTQTALGCHSINIITAVTAQNNTELSAINAVNSATFKQQIDAVASLPIGAIKSGLIANIEQLKALLKHLEKRQAPYICDPVLASTSGTNFSDENLLKAIKTELIPKAALITPNIPEAEKLSGISIQHATDVEHAAQVLLGLGAKAVYIKGGHRQHNSGYVQDYYKSQLQAFWLSSPKIDTHNNRGTGCAFASSVSAAQALGYPMADAVIIAKMAINQGLRQAYSLGQDSHLKGPVNISHFPDTQQDLPYLTPTANTAISPVFPTCTHSPLGLYPVVDSVQWLAKLLPLGITTAQIRNKSLSGQALEDEIKAAIALGKKYNCRLFINDYWQLAIKYQAYGVHLGQEDLDTADISAIHSAGLRLGTSTHCHYEVARAHSLCPSYIACGPVYKTYTKDMPWIPHGLKGLQYWQDTLDYPLVAIGGINKDRIETVAKTGVSAVAMISAITEAAEPQATSKAFMTICNKYCQ